MESASEEQVSRGEQGRGGAGARCGTLFGRRRAPSPQSGRTSSRCAARLGVSTAGLRVLQGQRIQCDDQASIASQHVWEGWRVGSQAVSCCAAHLEGQHLLPREHIGAVVAAKVTVCSSVDEAVAAALEVQGLANHAGAEVKGGLDCRRASERWRSAVAVVGHLPTDTAQAGMQK